MDFWIAVIILALLTVLTPWLIFRYGRIQRESTRQIIMAVWGAYISRLPIVYLGLLHERVYGNALGLLADWLWNVIAFPGMIVDSVQEYIQGQDTLHVLLIEVLAIIAPMIYGAVIARKVDPQKLPMIAKKALRIVLCALIFVVLMAIAQGVLTSLIDNPGAAWGVLALVACIASFCMGGGGYIIAIFIKE